MAGPLQGWKVVEMVGLGPAPFCAMMLADMGAQVIRVDRPGRAPGVLPDDPRCDVTARGRPAVAIDLKQPGGTQAVLRLIDGADALIEGFRPGVMERLGLGPEVCLQRNPGLVYGRMTGWGQHGPLAHAAGHDINYIAISGALHAIGRGDAPPTVPLNYIGDFGGGAMMLAFGVVCALLERQHSGKGQVIDAAMTDGAALLSAMMYGFKAAGQWSNRRADNLLDGGAHHYGTYRCADGRDIAIGPLEPQFYRVLLQRCGINDPDFADPQDKSAWPRLRSRLAQLFATRTRDEWCALLEGSDACFAPVLDWDEAPSHPHNRARHTFIDIDGVTQPAPAPRFSRTPPEVPAVVDHDAAGVLAQWGFTADEVAQLVAQGVLHRG